MTSDCCVDKVDASECCGALMITDYDICPECLEHTGIIEECDCEENKTIEKELTDNEISVLIKSLYVSMEEYYYDK
tara:strand:+ start:174 stop:401 length:228 start_codon:yes stop_codon:yes gene_type:complete